MREPRKYVAVHTVPSRQIQHAPNSICGTDLFGDVLPDTTPRTTSISSGIPTSRRNAHSRTPWHCPDEESHKYLPCNRPRSRSLRYVRRVLLKTKHRGHILPARRDKAAGRIWFVKA